MFLQSRFLFILYSTDSLLDIILTSNSITSILCLVIVSKILFRRTSDLNVILLLSEVHDNVRLLRRYQKLFHISTDVLIVVTRFGQLDPHISVKYCRDKYDRS